ncbi:NAD(P)-binding domain-containing protein [Streptomyces sp. NBC_00121]|uniref:NADPH-dependent F420 reductase n=1 Tax=unclassified Streptomyces TaxID=2593676 RepID=UPI002DDBE894|nr:NAD(P)-binding domain-containing protein [Streptomyces sp. NBC_01760]WSC73723.1 NAD(P)-binding domain-containing protein [Streptomyces sp. NBC_01760]WTE64109.1 NAD(P)-binding domain-containing protein [Streptomyces sp. NBC_01617]
MGSAFKWALWFRFSSCTCPQPPVLTRPAHRAYVFRPPGIGPDAEELVKRRDRTAHRTHHRKVGSMKIGIIGAGNIGGNLTRRLTALGHEVSIANSRGPHTLTALAEETGATPVTAAEAAQGARVVVITIPVKAVPNLPAGFLNGAAEDVAVIDTGNYYPQQRDGRVAAIEDGLPESRWTEEQIGHPVIKAFNGTYADDLLTKALPKGSPGRQALPVAGDDAAAKQTVRDLIDELGFDTVDAGGLDESWRQQPGTPVYGNRGDAETIAKALTAASPERSAEWRA